MSKLKAKDIMTPDVIKVPAGWSVHRLAEFFSENSISGALVIDENSDLTGVVSTTDIIKSTTLPEEDPDAGGPHDYYLRRLENRYTKVEISTLKIGTEPLTTAGDIMTPIIFKVEEETPIQQVAEEMLKHRIHRIFVTNGDKVVGIISSVDMLKVIRDYIK